MKKVIFPGGKEFEFDETAPCQVCGNPVLSLSMNGPDFCPGCDAGVWRNGKKWDLHRDTVWVLKQFWYLRPWVPTFDFVKGVVTALAAHGISTEVWDRACQVHLGGEINLGAV